MLSALTLGLVLLNMDVLPNPVRSAAGSWRTALLALFSVLAMSSLAALGAEPKIVVEVSKSADAFMVDALIDVPVPIEIAWGVLTDVDRSASFLENMTFSKIISRTGDTLIARQEGVARFGLLSFDFVTEREIRLEAMKRIATKQISGSFKRMRSEAIFVAIETGVQIRYSAEIVPDSKLALMFGESFVRHEVTGQFVQMGREMLRRYADAREISGAAEPPLRASELR